MLCFSALIALLYSGNSTRSADELLEITSVLPLALSVSLFNLGNHVLVLLSELF